MKVLIIDDDSNDRLLIKMELEKGFKDVETVEAANENAFFEAITKGPYDLVICDYLLRWSDGISITKIIKQKYPKTPVIMVTDSGDEEVAVRGMKIGLDDYVLKKNLNRLCISVNEVFAKVRMSEKLEESEQRYRTIAEMSPFGIFMLQDNTIVYVNRRFIQLFGITKIEDVLGRSFEEVVPDLYEHILIQCNKTGDQFYGEVEGEEVSIKRADNIKYLKIFIRPINYGEKKAFMGLIEDITKQKELESRLLRSQKLEAIGTFVGGIAHDFNNLLSVIIGYSDLLVNITNDKKLLDKIKKIQAACNKARDLVKNLLTFARPGKPEERISIDIVPLVEEICKLAKTLIPESIEFRCKIYKKGPLYVRTFPSHITQILLNLVNNAVQAIESQRGKIEVELDFQKQVKKPFLLESNDEYAVLKVKDNGKGIDSTVLNKIFEPYYTTKPQELGTGLGLSVVHGLVKDMKGEIEVKSTPGRGTEFIIFFPVTFKMTKNGEKFSVPNIEKKMKGNVLIVDDDKSVAAVVKEILQDTGFKVVDFTHPEDALNTFLKEPDKIDLLISDFTMPRMDGLELIKKIKAIKNDLPCILMTGYPVSLYDECRINRCEVLMKPFGKHELLKTIESLF
ncbi:hybrid sensor histidine kinase/response regulator [Desulfothermus sp.]